MASMSAFVLLGRDPRGVFNASLGIDPFALLPTPASKRVYIQIDALDDMAVVLKAPLRYLRSLQPLFPCPRQPSESSKMSKRAE